MDNNLTTKKNVLVITSTYPRWLGDHEPGFVHELSKRLIDEFNVTVLCPHAMKSSQEDILDGVTVYRYRYAPAQLESLVNNGGIVSNLKKSPWKLLLLPSFFLSQIVSINRIVNQKNIDVIHAHWLIPQGLSIAILSTLKKVPPFIVTSHGADLFALRGVFFNYLKRFVSNRASQVSVVSSVMKSELSKLGVNYNKISIMPMGVNMEIFCENPNIIRSKDEMLFVGRLVEKKGLRYLLSALPKILKKHPTSYLTIIGFGPEAKALKEQAKQLNIEKKVNFLGAVTQDKLVDYYQRAAVFVAPFIEAKSGDQEGLGLVLVEALGCGCPLVVSDIPACNDVIVGLSDIKVFSSGNSLELAQVVSSSLKSNKNHSVEHDKIAFEGKFGWDIVSSNYKEVLTKIITKV